MSERTVYEIVQAATSELTKSEKKVARILLSEYPAAGLVTVAELASRCGVSGQTVIRFAIRIGFESYPQFQSQLVKELKTRSESPLSQYKGKNTDLSEDQLLSDSLSSFTSTLEASFHKLPRHELQEAINLMANEKLEVRTTGGHFTELVADYLFRHLNQLRKHASFQSANPFLRSNALVDINKKTLLVVYDVRRYQNDTFEFAEQAHKKGATIILVTDPYLSPICRYAKVVLPVVVETISPFDSQHTLMALTEIMVTGVLNLLGEQGRQRLEEVEASRKLLSVPSVS